jgi:predicted RNA-binding Zn-ribbon protein involved in translation (DUF1610 family)
VSCGSIFVSDATITAGDILGHGAKRKITDAELRTTCPKCGGAELTLADCKVALGKETTYSCPKCGEALAVIFPATPGMMGYRFDRFQIRPAQDLRYRPPGVTGDVLFPKIAEKFVKK